ncbi:alpha/beta hydrolase [Ensifer sesbaniae]|uniref:alpha/beta hydrolase n=1 Tax=Ensifer sesbaniae TaxID=1214071 RepID=UPI002000C061|nr:alpha/beta hydrolase [Ensifer sesbaniae]
MNIPRLLLILLLSAVPTYLLLLGFIYLSQRTLLYPGAEDIAAPERASWGENVSVKTPDGETLHGLYSEGNPDRPSVLLFFGNGDRVDNYGFLAQALAARGIGLLAISYRGYPGSTGSPSENGLLTDGIAAFDWLASRVKGGIVVLGRSLGTGVAVNTATQRPATGMILVSPYLSVQSVAQARYPFLPVSLLIKDSFRSDLKIAAVKQPKLFIHGRLDDSIPLTSGEALYRIAAEPKQMLVGERSGHNDIWNDKTVSEVIHFVESLESDAT